MLPPLCRSVCPQTTWKGHLHPPSRVSHSSASGRGCRHHPGPTTSQIAQSGRGWRHLRVHLCHPCSGRDTWNKSPRATSRWGVKSSRGGGSTTSLISSVTRTVKKHILMFTGHPLPSSLCPVPLILILGTSGERLAPQPCLTPHKTLAESPPCSNPGAAPRAGAAQSCLSPAPHSSRAQRAQGQGLLDGCRAGPWGGHGAGAPLMRES